MPEPYCSVCSLHPLQDCDIMTAPRRLHCVLSAICSACSLLQMLLEGQFSSIAPTNHSVLHHNAHRPYLCMRWFVPLIPTHPPIACTPQIPSPLVINPQDLSMTPKPHRSHLQRKHTSFRSHLIPPDTVRAHIIVLDLSPFHSAVSMTLLMSKGTV